MGCDCSVGKGEVNGQGSIKFTFADDGSTATVQPGTEGKLNVEAIVMPYGLQCAGVYTVTSGEILGVVASGAAQESYQGTALRTSIEPAQCASDPTDCNYVCAAKYELVGALPMRPPLEEPLA